jgi:hypothetical protein
VKLIIGKDGSVRGIYGEMIALDALGPLAITGASDVEPDGRGRWLADLSPVGGQVLGPYQKRSPGGGSGVAGDELAGGWERGWSAGESE